MAHKKKKPAHRKNPKRVAAGKKAARTRKRNKAKRYDRKRLGWISPSKRRAKQRGHRKYVARQQRRKKSYSAHRPVVSHRQRDFFKDAYEDAARKYDDAVGKLMRARGIDHGHALSAKTWAELNSHPSVAPHHKKSREAYRRLVSR